jgi:amino acid adenylation domain-containing protein
MGRWLGDGNIEFLGRIDHQVKIRGFRVELGEIESRLLNHPGIKEAVVLAREDQRQVRYLCAYAAPDDRLTAAELREYLAAVLPDYMVPSYFVVLDALPLTPNRKIDRQALPSPGEDVTADETHTPPRTPVERKLVETWSEVLGLERETIGIDSNFFQLGGHSLNASIMAARIHKALDVRISLPDIFKSPTIRALAGCIATQEKERHSAVEPVEDREYYPLSSAQKRFYILQRMQGQDTVYNMPRSISMGKGINIEKIQQALEKLIQRHQSLRTSFHMVNGEPVQRIHETVTFRLENKQTFFRGPGGDFIRPFDLTQAPLLRAAIMETGDGNCFLIADLHHIISDAFSEDIVARDFMALYRGDELPPLALQYRDYAQWRENLENTPWAASQESYWLDELGGEAPVLDLPVDFPRPPVQVFDGSTLGFAISEKQTQELHSLALRQNVTPYMLLLAAFDVLLARLGGTGEVIVGTPVAGRRHADLEHIIGVFVNTLAIKTYPSGEKKLEDFLDEVKERTLEAFENQDCQFEDLVEKLDVQRNTARNPLFDVMFTLRKPGLQEINVIGGRVDDDSIFVSSLNQVAKFDITLTALDARDRLLFTFEYCARLFKEETIRRFMGYFKRILSAFTAERNRRIADVEILDEEEKHLLLREFNRTAVSTPFNKTLHGLFEEQADRVPDRIALIGEAHELHELHENEKFQVTYGLLNRKAGQLAWRLRERGVRPGDIVALMVRRSLEMITGILGILKAGAAYLPIDPGFPQERIDYMLEDSSAKTLLKELPEERPVHHPVFGIQHSSSLAYVMYTSGTTGRPRGVMIAHDCVVPTVKEPAYIDLDRKDRVLQLSNYAFDGSIFDIFASLLNGAALVLASTETLLDPHRLTRWVKRRQVTVFFVTTALFNALVDSGADCFDEVRKILFGGERVSLPHVRKALERLGKNRLLHMYGPTETAVFATCYPIDAVEENRETIPIGAPLPGTFIYLLDRRLNLAPLGAAAEIHIGGPGTAPGYMNRPGLTAEKFFSWSYRTDKTYRTYKTGDLGRWLADGSIEFLGRLDHQVKIRGFRIELGEIECHLNGCPAIDRAVVTCVTEEEKQHLCAYIVSSDYSPEDLKKYLSAKLPAYMIPGYFVRLEELPLTVNGKVDRRKLPRPGKLDRQAGPAYVPPETAAQQHIAAIWKEVLGRETVGIRDNFFDLGGNSLDFIKVSARLKEELDREIPVLTLFTYPTVASLAEHLAGDSENQTPKDEDADRTETIDEGKQFMRQTLARLDREDDL